MVELAEDELKNFFKVWASILVSLSYCYIIGKLTSPNGYTRLLAILPIIGLFLALPLKLTSFHFCGMSSFLIAWLANFKLLLFAFGKGPLCSNPPLSFPHFLAIACLPIKTQDVKPQNNEDPIQKHQIKPCPPPKNSTSPWNYIIKLAILIMIFQIYDYIPQQVIWLMYFIHIYFLLELLLALLAISAKILLGFELEPQFNEPLLSTSLQDFWGRRWNLMVTTILRPSVYLPVRNFSTKVLGLGRRWAQLLAVMATFVVSAIMHELIFYYLGRLRPTFEVTWFFLLHGFCLCFEIVVKKVVGEKWRVPRWVSGPATAVFVVGTGLWLFLPPLVRAGLDTRPFQEYSAVGEFVRSLRRSLYMG